VLRREVLPAVTAWERRWKRRAAVAGLSLLLWSLWLGVFTLATGCGRGGAPPCVPQPALSNTGPGGYGPPRCEVRR
jgi:hypothetical protein